MITKINLKIISTIFFLFIFLQMVIAVVTGYDFLNTFGLIHYLLFGFFLLFFSISQGKTIKQIFVLIALYQIFLVLSLFIYYNTTYGNPLGFNPTDGILYDSLGHKLQSKSLSESINYILSRYGISDLGFPLAVKYIYALGGNEIFNLKIFNIIFHLLSCFFVFRISELLFTEKSISKIVLILYGLNPISVYFNASGRKEPLFILIMTICFFLVYKAILEKNFKYYLLGFLSILTTGLFRTIFPVFILLAFGFFQFLNVQGKYKFLTRIAYFLFGLIILSIAVIFIQNDLADSMAVDQDALAAARIGRIPTYLDYAIMTISGFIGPFPSFVYQRGNDSALLQTIGNFVKIFLSYFFLVGSYRILKGRIQILYPILLFIIFNVIMLVSVAAALDHRFLYPFIPVYFIVIGYGFNIIKEKRHFTKLPAYLLGITTLIIAYNLR